MISEVEGSVVSQRQKQVAEKKDKKLNEKFTEVGGDIVPGVKVKMTRNRQVGIVKEIRGKNAVVQLGTIPITVSLNDLVVVVDKIEENEAK